MIIIDKFQRNDQYILEKMILIEPHSSFFQFLWRKIANFISPESLSKIVAISSQKENTSYNQNFMKTLPHHYLKSLMKESLIPSLYGGSSTTFKHTVLQYSFDNSDVSTFDDSIEQKPAVFHTSTCVYDVQQTTKLKQKIKFLESNIYELVKTRRLNFSFLFFLLKL